MSVHHRTLWDPPPVPGIHVWSAARSSGKYWNEMSGDSRSDPDARLWVTMVTFDMYLVSIALYCRCFSCQSTIIVVTQTHAHVQNNK